MLEKNIQTIFLFIIRIYLITNYEIDRNLLKFILLFWDLILIFLTLKQWTRLLCIIVRPIYKAVVVFVWIIYFNYNLSVFTSWISDDHGSTLTHNKTQNKSIFDTFILPVLVLSASIIFLEALNDQFVGFFFSAVDSLSI